MRVLFRCEHTQTDTRTESKQSPLLPAAAVIASASPVIALNLPAAHIEVQNNGGTHPPTHPPGRWRASLTAWEPAQSYASCCCPLLGCVDARSLFSPAEGLTSKIWLLLSQNAALFFFDGTNSPTCLCCR